MDAVKEYQEIYAENIDGVTNLLSKLDLNDPSKSVFEKPESLSLMLEQFIRAQSATTSSLIKFDLVPMVQYGPVYYHMVPDEPMWFHMVYIVP